MMKGWKTWAGALIMAVGAGLRYFGYVEIADLFEQFGLAILGIGIAHKVEKAVRKKK